ncbi:LodA/GoxA family CTQ-dependent oxidase [Streptomyces cinerochromogenes]|uniref:LodA/GoxA family CTQ-dependent oxidase n=1 Tax=Streptomyces cinerochromogenes TaxID=66422 RepID=UPI0016708CEB|nr:LodA/GoxA family CTQ-dependent oxidase [Streptomyces cinerochromogenes]
MNLDDLAYCEIHPTVGVARLGNSPDSFFVGPEAPGVAARPEDGFKDADGRVKRQAARFRLYGYDKDHNLLGEVTSNEATVRWAVELANAKAAWFKFHGRFHQSEAPENRRNATIGVSDPQQRAALVISPGPRSVEGANADGSGAKFDTGTFLGTPVPLGELRTDEAGRLLVLGGFGHSASVKQPANLVTNYANNDYWFDDTSDGPVTATVTVGQGRTIPVTPAWVLVAPPDFAPDSTNLVTLYDVAREVAENAGWLPRSSDVSFSRDILPLLTRICGYAWVSGVAVRGHGDGRAGDFLDPDRLARLASNAPEDAPPRKNIFGRLRTPGAEDVTQANYTFMPQLAGDDGDPVEGKPRTWFTILPGQYERMRRWASGDFVADGTDVTSAVPLADLPLAEQPHALVRAALEACNGGPFFPGIEMTFIADDPATWAGAFRLRDGLAPGDVTKYMAVPWQADFYECNTHWWPAQRPDDVLPEEQYRELIRTAAEKAGEQYVYRTPWDRGIGLQAVDLPQPARQAGETDHDYAARLHSAWDTIRAYSGDNDMVEKWSQLGFVVARTDASGGTVLVETERAEQVGLSDREWFYFLQHPDRFPKQAQAARQYAQDVLKHAASNPRVQPSYRPFRYSAEAFKSRLELIYSDLVQAGENANPARSIYRSRQDVVERIRQLAPFNLMDGAWLRNVTKPGPISEVHSLLFAIWTDEQGNGNPALNHANLYTDLLHSVGLYLPPVDSYEFAMLPEMLDSAYTAAAFELAISQHSEEFFPEILGMTLWLEWEVLGLKPTVRLFEYYGINPQFYTMHIGIDNATNGHGAKARDAVVQYLEGIYEDGGDAAVQQQWQRIWNGYVAFATVGNLSKDLRDLLLNPPSPEDRVLDLIARKAPYASQNHDGKTLGENKLNDWFLDPAGLLQELQDSGLIVPGDPDKSSFFEKTTYTGPMYKVFSESELELWRQWTRSLTAPPTGPVLTPLKAMTLLVDTLRPRQAGNPAHTKVLLTGPDPTDHAVPPRTRTESVAWWFTQPTGALLAALAHPDNQLVSPGHPDESGFITDLIAPANAMGAAFEAVVPGTEMTGTDIARWWVTEGCPLPGPALLAGPVLLDAIVLPAAGIAVPEADGGEPVLQGMGMVH